MRQGVRCRVYTTRLKNKLSQHNQLKFQPNAPVDVKASAIIKYTNLENG